MAATGRCVTNGSDLAAAPLVYAETVTPLGAGNSNALGDRATQQDGDTRLAQPGAIQVSSWEPAKPHCWQSCCLALKCSYADETRTYLYLRDNRSIEINDTNGIKNCCTCCCEIQDNVSVFYYDRAPFAKECRLFRPDCKICGVPWLFIPWCFPCNVLCCWWSCVRCALPHALSDPAHTFLTLGPSRALTGGETACAGDPQTAHRPMTRQCPRSSLSPSLPSRPRRLTA